MRMTANRFENELSLLVKLGNENSSFGIDYYWCYYQF